MMAQNAIEKNSSTEDRIATIFRLATSRKPSTKEIQSLADYLQGELAYFKETPEKAKSYLAIGEYQMDYALPEPEMAAYAMLASTIFNLDESISRG